MAKIKTFKLETENCFGNYSIVMPEKEDKQATDSNNTSTKQYLNAVVENACDELDKLHKLEIRNWMARFLQATKERDAIFAILNTDGMTMEEKKEAAALVYTETSDFDEIKSRLGADGFESQTDEDEEISAEAAHADENNDNDFEDFCRELIKDCIPAVTQKVTTQVTDLEKLYDSTQSIIDFKKSLDSLENPAEDFESLLYTLNDIADETYNIVEPLECLSTSELIDKYMLGNCLKDEFYDINGLMKLCYECRKQQ